VRHNARIQKDLGPTACAGGRLLLRHDRSQRVRSRGAGYQASFGVQQWFQAANEESRLRTRATSDLHTMALQASHVATWLHDHFQTMISLRLPTKWLRHDATSNPDLTWLWPTHLRERKEIIVC